MNIVDLIVDIEMYFIDRGWVTSSHNTMVNCICMNMYNPHDMLIKKTMKFFNDKLCIHPFYFVADSTKHTKMTKEELIKFKDNHSMLSRENMMKYDQYMFEHINGLLVNYLKNTNNDGGMYITSHHFSTLEIGINKNSFGTWDTPRLYYFTKYGGVFHIRNESSEYQNYFKDFIK